MSMTETPLQSARRRLREAERRVDQQRQTVEALRKKRLCTRLANELLAELERQFRTQEDEVRRLQRDKEGS
jgi:hypothetical protein